MQTESELSRNRRFYDILPVFHTNVFHETNMEEFIQNRYLENIETEI